MKKIYVIDASNYLYRSYHAIRYLTNDLGESTNAVFGFIRSILKIINDFNPEYMVSIFDAPKGSDKRKKIYSEYKAKRAKMPDDLRYQIDWAKEFCDLIGLPKLSMEGVEADDTMGTIVSWTKERDFAVYLCTGDKDFCQLIGDRVFVLNTYKNNLILDKKSVVETFGVPPDQFIDLLSLAGDQSDNVPGLPGIGLKTGAKLLQDFGSLDNILANPEKVAGKKKQEIIKNEKELALISRKLVTIETDVPIPKNEDFFVLRNPDIENLNKFYSRMNFTSMIAKSENVEKQEEMESVEYNLVDEEKKFDELISFLSTQKEICFDTETTSVNPMEAELVGVGFAIKAKQAWYVPVNGKLGLENALKRLKPFFENPNIGFFGHNIKYDMHIMKNYGIVIKNISNDTILASYILNSHNRRHSLDILALQYFGKVKIALSDLIGKGKNEITMKEVAIEKAAEYCCEDVDYTFRLKEILLKELQEKKLLKLYQELEIPLIRVLHNMERAGIFIDKEQLKNMGVDVNGSLKILEDEIYKLAGETFNIKSPKQLSQILFEKLGITPGKKTESGYSTNADVLENIKDSHPIAEKVLEFRMLEKLRSTYIEALPTQVNVKTKRIHPNFNQSVAATGRLTCQNPNLQNIPIRTSIGKKIRYAFRPQKEGWSYLSSDYSQIELRLIAHFSLDPTLIQAFKDKVDIHAHTAASIFNIPIDKVDLKQRSLAKAVNFGIMYGMGPFGLSKELSIEIEEAKSFIDCYFKRYQKVKEFLEYCKEKTRKEGKATTLYGRERLIPEISSKNQQIRAFAERLAVNTPLQGTNADIIKHAMINIDNKLQKEKKLGYMILQIHDELIFEIPDFEIIDFNSLVKNEMEKVIKLKVPLVVDITVGKNWQEC